MSRQLDRSGQFGVRPGEEDNFDFSSSASLITQFNQMSAGLKIAAFVMVIGIVFGTVPAIRASKLDPIEAWSRRLWTGAPGSRRGIMQLHANMRYH